jgi:multidrug efflux system outer membrane protein
MPHPLPLTSTTTTPPHRRLPRLCAAGALAAATLLAACASMAPPHARPDVALAPAWDGAAGGGVNAAATSWRDYFTDPRSRDLVEQALANSQDVRSAALRVDEARAGYRIQRADGLPTLAAQGGMTRSRTPADLSLVGVPLVGSEFQVALGLASWEIDLWGRVHSLRDAALENFLASDEARRGVTLSLIAQVVDADLALRELDERLALARRSIASRQETLRIFTRRVEVGSTSRLNLTQVQTLLTQSQALAAQLEQARALQLHALTLLVGAPLVLPAQADDAIDAFPALAPGLPSDLLLQRPDIAAAEHGLKAAEANIGAARAAFFPRVALTASFGTASAEFNGLFAAGSQAWSLAPGISLPLFDAGRLRGNLEVTKVRRELAVASYRTTVQAAFRDVADALSSARWLDEQLAIAHTALATSTERARLARLRFDNGAAAFLDVLDAQRDLLATEQQLVQVRHALLRSHVALYAALGGGSMALAPAATPALP